jgi:hypothetical protein
LVNFEKNDMIAVLLGKTGWQKYERIQKRYRP